MHLSVRHSTIYRYARPVALQPHRLVLFPRGQHDVRVVDSKLDISPGSSFDWSEDIFGNRIATATFDHPSDLLCINSAVTVDLRSPEFPVFAIAPCAHSYPFDYSPDERIDLGAMLRQESYEQQGKMRNWAQSFVLGPTTDTLSLLQDMNTGILNYVTYRTRDEAGTQKPLETLDFGSGSCRDIAALFIDAVRHLGFGARAVSGYLFDPAASDDDAGSTHAWAEVYLPGAGWITFDPTHRRMGAANLIPVAVGRRNDQIMPVTGGYAGTADDFITMEIAVDVSKVDS